MFQAHRASKDEKGYAHFGILVPLALDDRMNLALLILLQLVIANVAAGVTMHQLIT